MIDISQWRASIGLFNSSRICTRGPATDYVTASNSKRVFSATIATVGITVTMICCHLSIVSLLLLLLSGDVELNPGPTTGKQQLNTTLIN